MVEAKNQSTRASGRKSSLEGVEACRSRPGHSEAARGVRWPATARAPGPLFEAGVHISAFAPEPLRRFLRFLTVTTTSHILMRPTLRSCLMASFATMSGFHQNQTIFAA
jgi:hypothetical protein